MTRSRWLIILFCLGIVSLSGGTGVTVASMVDPETSNTNDFQAWTSSVWTQTSQEEFETGVADQVDTAASSGNVILAKEMSLYVESGTMASQVLDTGHSGSRWDGLFWDSTLPAGTGITLEVRASDTVFAKDTPPGTLPWTSVGATSPVTDSLPSGRYIQWRATLTTSDPIATPTLSEVRVYHY